MWYWISKVVLSLAMGLAIFFSLLLLTFYVGISRALDAQVYAQALADQDAYARIYSEVLTAELIGDLNREFFEETPLVLPEDVWALAVAVAPPSYLQGETEGNLNRAFSYLDGEADSLDLYLDLPNPLNRIPGAAR